LETWSGSCNFLYTLSNELGLLRTYHIALLARAVLISVVKSSVNTVYKNSSPLICSNHYSEIKIKPKIFLSQRVNYNIPKFITIVNDKSMSFHLPYCRKKNSLILQTNASASNNHCQSRNSIKFGGNSISDRSIGLTICFVDGFEIFELFKPDICLIKRDNLKTNK
jgi:hypothetical protein